MLPVDCLSLEIKNNGNSVKPLYLRPPIELDFYKSLFPTELSNLVGNEIIN